RVRDRVRVRDGSRGRDGNGDALAPPPAVHSSLLPLRPLRPLRCALLPSPFSLLPSPFSLLPSPCLCGELRSLPRTPAARFFDLVSTYVARARVARFRRRALRGDAIRRR